MVSIDPHTIRWLSTLRISTLCISQHNRHHIIINTSLIKYTSLTTFPCDLCPFPATNNSITVVSDLSITQITGSPGALATWRLTTGAFSYIPYHKDTLLLIQRSAILLLQTNSPLPNQPHTQQNICIKLLTFVQIVFCAASSLNCAFFFLEKVMMANPKEVDYNKTGLKWMTIGKGTTAQMEFQ
jgi:hypothetical protein